MSKVKELGQIPEGTILYNIDFVGLYLNIAHDEVLTFPTDFFDSRVDKLLAKDTLMELTKLMFLIKLRNKFAEQQFAQSLHQSLSQSLPFL